MSDGFRDTASIDYPILDCDAHVNEPPDLWLSRVPATLRWVTSPSSFSIRTPMSSDQRSLRSI